MINADVLIKNGYSQYQKTAGMNKYCNRFFQKRFRDENGNTKYFITIYEYKMGILNLDLDYEVELQFGKGDYTMNLTLFCLNPEMTINDIENEVYKIWDKLECEYYEKSDD